MVDSPITYIKTNAKRFWVKLIIPAFAILLLSAGTMTLAQNAPAPSTGLNLDRLENIHIALLDDTERQVIQISLQDWHCLDIHSNNSQQA